MTSLPPECRAHRSTLSAALDGAALPDDTVAAERHLVHCAGCRSFRSALDRLQDIVDDTVVPPAPDLVHRVMTEGPARSPAVLAGWDPRGSVARSMLAAVALAQISLGVPPLVLAHQSGLDLHAGRHLGAWAIAFGVGMLVAAGRPSHASALLPVAATLGIVVAAGALVDLVAGGHAGPREAVHLLELIGLGLLAIVSREEDGGQTTSPATAAPAG